MILVCCCALNFIVLNRMGRDIFTLEMTASGFESEYSRIIPGVRFARLLEFGN